MAAVELFPLRLVVMVQGLACLMVLGLQARRLAGELRMVIAFNLLTMPQLLASAAVQGGPP